MNVQRPEFLMGIEQECLTVCETPPAETLAAFAEAYRQFAPSLPDVTGNGCFNAYGRMYIDAGPHVELASAEADTPEALVKFVEQQQLFAAATLCAIGIQGYRLRLANNNHSGLLSLCAPAWGNHANYLVPQHPSELADRVLPFLATCPFGGAGGILTPSGNYISSVRSQFMAEEIGGGTTRDRAMITTGRNEHLAGNSPQRFRLHTIVFDGQRSQLGIYLRFATTAMVLQAIAAMPEAIIPMPHGSRGFHRRFWAQAMRRLNHLAIPGEQPQVHPQAIAVQRLYFELCERWSIKIPELPAWVHVALERWTTALDAMQRSEDTWLAERFDPWIKHRMFTACLENHGKRWQHLPNNRELLAELALLDQQYHEFGFNRSPFDRLERAGLLRHRVVKQVLPGDEAEPFVPQVATRAQARARALLHYSGQQSLTMDWDALQDTEHHRIKALQDPFAAAYSDWRLIPTPTTRS